MSFVNLTHKVMSIPTHISLVEPCNGYCNIYSINPNGCLSWDIHTSEEEIEEDKYTIIVSSSIIQKLFSRDVSIYNINHSIIAVMRKSSDVYVIR